MALNNLNPLKLESKQFKFNQINHVDFINNESNSFSDGNWFINITDLDGSVLHSVVCDSTFPNLTRLPGFAFKLRNRGFDNDQLQGGNWDRSCNIYGSPGDEPLKNCPDICSTTLCQANVPSQWKDYGIIISECDCNDVEHYYSNGCSCTPVPAHGDCYVYWERAFTTGDEYFLSYPVGGSYQYIALYNRYKI